MRWTLLVCLMISLAPRKAGATNLMTECKKTMVNYAIQLMQSEAHRNSEAYHDFLMAFGEDWYHPAWVDRMIRKLQREGVGVISLEESNLEQRLSGAGLNPGEVAWIREHRDQISALAVTPSLNEEGKKSFIFLNEENFTTSLDFTVSFAHELVHLKLDLSERFTNPELYIHSLGDKSEAMRAMVEEYMAHYLDISLRGSPYTRPKWDQLIMRISGKLYREKYFKPVKEEFTLFLYLVSKRFQLEHPREITPGMLFQTAITTKPNHMRDFQKNMDQGEWEQFKEIMNRTYLPEHINYSTSLLAEPFDYHELRYEMRERKPF